MNDKILDGKALAEKLNLALKVKINEAVDKIGIKPKIVTILVGEDPASKVYLNMKKRTSAFVGIESEILELDEHISNEKITEEINKLNTNDNVHGILLQLPLPKSQASNTLNYIENISPKKDVDGLTPVNKGKLYDYNECTYVIQSIENKK